MPLVRKALLFSVIIASIIFIFSRAVFASPSISLSTGWNLISITDSFNQSNCQLNVPIWHWDPLQNQYTRVSDFPHMTPGSGYWVKVSSGCSLTPGSGQLTVDSFQQLQSGWNMIGGPSSSVDFSSVLGNCDVISGPWKYNSQTNQYENSQTLDAGFGYWVKVKNNCNLTTTSNSSTTTTTTTTTSATELLQISENPGDAANAWGACVAYTPPGGVQQPQICAGNGKPTASENVPYGSTITYLCTADWNGNGSLSDYSFQHWTGSYSSSNNCLSGSSLLTVTGPVSIEGDYSTEISSPYPKMMMSWTDISGYNQNPNPFVDGVECEDTCFIAPATPGMQIVSFPHNLQVFLDGGGLCQSNWQGYFQTSILPILKGYESIHEPVRFWEFDESLLQGCNNVQIFNQLRAAAQQADPGILVGVVEPYTYLISNFLNSGAQMDFACGEDYGPGSGGVMSGYLEGLVKAGTVKYACMWVSDTSTDGSVHEFYSTPNTGVVTWPYTASSGFTRFWGWSSMNSYINGTVAGVPSVGTGSTTAVTEPPCHGKGCSQGTN